MGKGKQAVPKQPEAASPVDTRSEEDKAVDIEIEHTKNSVIA